MEMQNTPAAAPEATPPIIIERKSGNKTFKIFLGVILVALLLLVGGVVGLLLKSNLETSVDCDVGPWGQWTSCYLPPDMCGVEAGTDQGKSLKKPSTTARNAQ